MTAAEFKATRKALGLTQPALAALIGYDKMTISRFERGVVPISRVVALALAALTMAAQTRESGSR